MNSNLNCCVAARINASIKYNVAQMILCVQAITLLVYSTIVYISSFIVMHTYTHTHTHTLFKGVLLESVVYYTGVGILTNFPFVT